MLYNKWTKSDLLILEEQYGKISLEQLSREIDHSIGSIHQKAWQLGFKFTPPRWKNKETRRCSVCKEYKNITLFSKSKASNDGYNKSCKGCAADRNYKYYYDLKNAAYEIYGGYKCACCGLEPKTEKEKCFLQLDHVNNDGYKHRKLVGGRGSGERLYKWLKDNEYPKGLIQVLCANCNAAKKLNGGICPHQDDN